jgi:hypothetical protein
MMDIDVGAMWAAGFFRQTRMLQFYSFEADSESVFAGIYLNSSPELGAK